VYQNSYHPGLDYVALPQGWNFLDFVKFSRDDDRTTWEHISQYFAQLGGFSSIDEIKVYLFSFSLTRTTFSFALLPPNSIHS